jgi:hypothetical protein
LRRVATGLHDFVVFYRAHHTKQLSDEEFIALEPGVRTVRVMMRRSSASEPERLARRWLLVLVLGVIVVTVALIILRSLPRAPSDNVESFGRSTTTQGRLEHQTQ